MAVIHVPSSNEKIQGKDQVKKFLKQKGVHYDTWTAEKVFKKDASSEEVLAAYEGTLKPFMQSGGYTVCDVIVVHPQIENLLELRKKFLKEHTHVEDEIRFFVEGEGLFWFNLDGLVFSVLCQAGDLLSVPKNVKHWFDLGPSPFVKAIRIFIDKAGWVPYYTESGLDQKYNPTYL